MRRHHALPTTDSGMKAQGNDLLLIRSSAAKFDQQSTERGLNLRALSDSTDQAVEILSEALNVAPPVLPPPHCANSRRGVFFRNTLRANVEPTE